MEYTPLGSQGIPQSSTNSLPSAVSTPRIGDQIHPLRNSYKNRSEVFIEEEGYTRVGNPYSRTYESDCCIEFIIRHEPVGS
jgi:hypothetical protein